MLFVISNTWNKINLGTFLMESYNVVRQKEVTPYAHQEKTPKIY